MGALHVTYYTDPACPYSWAAEPALRRLQVEFAEGLAITYVMGGLAREFRKPLQTMRHVLDAASESGMPTDPRLWLDAPPSSSYPACQAVKAAAEQHLDGPYLRVVREGLMVDRLKLDNADALIDAARRVPAMNVERFAIDLRSHAIVEAFGADLERTRAAARDGEPRVPFPSFEVRGEGDEVHWIYDSTDLAQLRQAALAAGGAAQTLPDALGAVRRFARIATPEVAAVCDRPGPLAAADLWRLAA
ncbi:MAG TPA: DsbA family protein, partial [Solirubrobacteraceae bacterium]|nr:DsbA family protein [Solirubrobacteraceae bacterium]